MPGAWKRHFNILGTAHHFQGRPSRAPVGPNATKQIAKIQMFRTTFGGTTGAALVAFVAASRLLHAVQVSRGGGSAAAAVCGAKTAANASYKGCSFRRCSGEFGVRTHTCPCRPRMHGHAEMPSPSSLPSSPPQHHARFSLEHCKSLIPLLLSCPALQTVTNE